MSTSPPDEKAVRDVLAGFQDPETGRSITKLEQVHRLTLTDEKISVTLGLTTWSAPLREATRAELTDLLRRQFPGPEVRVELAEHERAAEKLGEVGVPAKSVVAVASGKGGVGKSSLAAFLAFGLGRAGCKVGLLDADVYGPSVPQLIGDHGRPTLVGDRFRPVECRGVKVMSMGYLVPGDSPVIWRGPMLHSALTQLLRDTDWKDLDYLIVDLPPGTGDVPISLAQLVPLSGAVVVCTPQQVALLDAVKAIAMFRRVNIDVLGMVENMSFFVCGECNARHEIFGSGGAQQQAAELGIPFLGEVPLVTRIRTFGDEGQTPAALEDETLGPYLEALCRKLAESLAARRRQRPSGPELPVLG
jgi:ATP-binding protein involved in chromosome partitioning